MKTTIIQGSTVDELKAELDAWLEKNSYTSFPQKEPAECKRIENIQQFAFQIVTPNTFNPQQPKVEMKYQLLIIYS